MTTKTSEEMNLALFRLKLAMVDSYKEQYENQEEKVNTYSDGIGVIKNTKYIRVVSNGAAWAFVVNVHNDKDFAYGDLLKAKTWKGPSRNFARGNVFVEYEAKWTGI